MLTGQGTDVGVYPIEPSRAQITDTQGNSETGNYRITYVKGNLTISPISINNAPVVLDSVPLIYTGSSLTPTILTIDGRKLTEGSDYTVRYSRGETLIESPIDVGTYTMTITGTGRYTGSTSTDFTIEKAPEKVVSTVPLIAKMTAKGKKKLVLRWTKVEGADGYDVFFERCNTSKKTYVYKKVASLKSSKTTWTKNGLKANAKYKTYVKAYVMENGSKKYISKSPIARAYTGGWRGNYTNPKSVSVKNSSVTVKAGKTSKIKATVKKLRSGKKLVNTKTLPKLRYLSSNTSVATVTKKGTIKGVSAGTCKIYAIATNGVSRAVTVTVKSVI